MYYQGTSSNGSNPYYQYVQPGQKAGDAGGPLGSGGDIDWSDFASNSNSESGSRSFTGLPGWAGEWAKNWWGSYNRGISDLWGQWHTQVQDKSAITGNKQNDLGSLTGNLNEMRGNFSENTGNMKNYVEQARTQMPEQYRNQMDLYTQRSLQPVLNNLSSRGVLNSSVTSGALSDVLRDQQAKYLDEVTKANVWAANQNYDTDKYVADNVLGIDKYGTEAESELNRYFTDKDIGQDAEKRAGFMQHFGTQFGMLPQLLNAIRESQSESSGSSSSFGGLLELLMAGLGE